LITELINEYYLIPILFFSGKATSPFFISTPEIIDTFNTEFYFIGFMIQNNTH